VHEQTNDPSKISEDGGWRIVNQYTSEIGKAGLYYLCLYNQKVGCFAAVGQSAFNYYILHLFIFSLVKCFVSTTHKYVGSGIEDDPL
jgi:hypothetical protein